jgi:hypothetical protein
MLPTKIGPRAFTRREEEYVMGLTKSELVGAYHLLYGGIERANGGWSSIPTARAP